MARKTKQTDETRALVAKLNAERVARGVCRHCGGPVPCWSPYGDVAVGRRHARGKRAV